MFFKPLMIDSDGLIHVIVCATSKSLAESVADRWYKRQEEFDAKLSIAIQLAKTGCEAQFTHVEGKVTPKTIVCLAAEDDNDWEKVKEYWKAFFRNHPTVVVGNGEPIAKKWAKEINALIAIDWTQDIVGFKDIKGRLISAMNKTKA